MVDDEPPEELPEDASAEESAKQDAPAEPSPEVQPVEDAPTGETAAEAAPPPDEEPTAIEEPAEVVEEPAAPVEEPVATVRETPAGERAKPAIPGADLEVDIVPEGSDPLAREQALSEFEVDGLEAEPTPEQAPSASEAELPKATIDLASGARYIATGKRKTAVARVILKPGTGDYTINGKGLNEHFPRQTAQRNIRQPLETVGYESRMDVVAKLHGGGISAQAGALRHGIARALIDADPNLRTELKRRGFLTRDSRAKERRKAGLKKARKKPQFSKR